MMASIRNIAGRRLPGRRAACAAPGRCSAAVQRDRGQAGFTLVETMLALAILVLLTGIVASGIPVASETYTKSVDAANAEVALTTTAAKLRDELGLAQDVFYKNDEAAEHDVVFYKRSDGYWAKIEGPSDDGKSLRVQAYSGVPNVNGESPDYGLTAFGSPIPLIPDSTMVGNLKVKLGGKITYNSAKGVFTINGLEVTSSDGKKLSDTGDGEDKPLKVKAAFY